MWQLIASRAVMGAAAALIMPATLSIIINVFPPEERTKAIAIWASITGAAGGFGPLVSGWLLGHFWYGSVFLINVPIIIVALIGGRFLVPRSTDPEEARLDPLGAVLSIVGIVALVYGLIEAPDSGLAQPQHARAPSSSPPSCSPLFVLWELHIDEPMLDIRFFRNPAFSAGTAGMMLVFLAMYGVMFLVTQYFQLVLGYSPLSAAARLLPMAHDPAGRLPHHAQAHRPLRRPPHRGLRHAAARHRPAPAQPASAPHTPYWYIIMCFLPFSTADGAGDVADDGLDHVGGARPARRHGLGHERRHPGARRRPRRRRARQHRRLPLRLGHRFGDRGSQRCPTTRRRAVRSPAPSTWRPGSGNRRRRR